MKEIFIVNAKYQQGANRAIIAILNGLSQDEREKERGSYFGSLSRLAAHNLEGTLFLLSLFKEVAAKNPGALKVYETLEKVPFPPKGPLTEAQWKELAAAMETTDQALVDFVSSLTEGDLQAPVKVKFFGGNPDSVPLFFMLAQLTVHGTHHRGQISQILDEMKIDNDYSMIDITCLP